MHTIRKARAWPTRLTLVFNWSLVSRAPPREAPLKGCREAFLHVLDGHGALQRRTNADSCAVQQERARFYLPWSQHTPLVFLELCSQTRLDTVGSDSGGQVANEYHY